jgi:hypothetical protein
LLYPLGNEVLLYLGIRDFEFPDGVLDRGLCVRRFNVANGRKGHIVAGDPPPVKLRWNGSFKAHLPPSPHRTVTALDLDRA